MQETICPTCGQPRQGDPCPYCLAEAGIGSAKGTPPAASDGGFSEGLPPVRPARERTPSTSPADDPKSKPTAAGCFLSLICVAIIFGSAVPIVTWRDPESGLPIPRMIAIAAPFLAGGLCYAIGAGILTVLGISIVQKRTEPTDVDRE